MVSGESVPPVDGPMLPVVPDTPSPGCGRPSSEPVRARGMVLPAVTSLVEGESEPDGAAAASQLLRAEIATAVNPAFGCTRR